MRSHKLIGALRVKALTDQESRVWLPVIENATKFYHVHDSPETHYLVMNAHDLAEQRMQEATFALPFQQTLFEIYFGENTRWLQFVYFNENNTILMRMFEMSKTGISLDCPTMTILPCKDKHGRFGLVKAGLLGFNSKPTEWIKPDTEDKKSRSVMINYAIGVGLVTLLTMTGVSTITTMPPDKLQKARAKTGKVPLYEEFRTLKLDIGKIRFPKVSLGGTHASPRKHDRRGHIRTLKDGREIPIRWCTVGDLRNGLVEKDYTLSIPGI